MHGRATAKPFANENDMGKNHTHIGQWTTMDKEKNTPRQKLNQQITH